MGVSPNQFKNRSSACGERKNDEGAKYGENEEVEMKKIKKVLAVLLTAVMLISTVVVSPAAPLAGTTKYERQKEE